MRATSIVFRRELAAYLTSPIGYVVGALALLVNGIVFQAYALGVGPRLSADVLHFFFLYTSVATMVLGVTLSIRLLAEERQQHTIVLLNTSPVRDWEVIAGKFLSAWVFLSGLTILSIYMPLLILVNGKIAWGELVVGYLGLILLGGASLAIGVFASSLTRHTLVAATVAAATNVILVLLHPLAKRIDEPLRGVLQELDLWWLNFQGSFMIGILELEDVVYYLAIIYFFLLVATKTLEAKRWQ
jgi:ABC-2 type transport system permease protein